MCENVSINNRYSDVPERNNALENGLQNTEIYKTRPRNTTIHRFYSLRASLFYLGYVIYKFRNLCANTMTLTLHQLLSIIIKWRKSKERWKRNF